ncbi:flavodoxin family protein, partial [Gluconobacter cerinus]|nr:flavodoxin family protein [Gluconobacter cerinus]
RLRMSALTETPPIAYRQQNGGDYQIPTMQLLPNLEEPGITGFALHLQNSKE